MIIRIPHLIIITILISLFGKSMITNNIIAKTSGNNEISEKVDLLISQLTLEEKASLCSGRDDWSTNPIDRLNIPWIWVSDGPHGLRRAPETNKAGYGDQLPATCFPTASALAATWDLDLVHKVGKAIGKECQALDVNILLGPGVNIKRSVLGGRNFEFFSEDPILSGELGAAYINGVQSEGIGTSLKHYVANNVETMRMYMNSDVDNRTLHEIYLTPFEIAVKKAQPWTVMACYNRVQGVYGTQSPYLLDDILKKEWGYKGIVISDWFAVVDRVEGLKSGLHIEMPGVAKVNDKLIVEAVNNGSLKIEVLDQTVREILSIVLKAKSLEKNNSQFNENEHHQLAREVAAESITLLKNENKILPISEDKYKSIAIIGEFAVSPRFQGNGSSEVKPTKLDNILDILNSEYGGNYKITYSQGYSLSNDDDFSLIEDAKKIAAESDIALIFAGLPLHYESEGIDRTHINMPASHNRLISEISSQQKNTVVVLTNGSAIKMPWVNKVSGLLETWLGGQAGAGGAADVLFGKINPSGKLAETFPMRLEDTPAYMNFPGEEGEVLYGERIFVGYRHFDKKKINPLFPFGYGLSYTTFYYSDLKVSNKNITDNEGLTVSLKIKNIGKVKGKEVVQLYVSDKQSKLIRPEKELKKFAKIELEPGEENEVSFTLSARDFSYYDSHRNMWIAESGEFDILIGSSSRNIEVKETINLQSTQNVPVTFTEYTFIREFWENKDSRELIKQLVPSWISEFTPEGKTADEANIHDFFIDHPIIKLPYISKGEVSYDQIDELLKKCKEITYTP